MAGTGARVNAGQPIRVHAIYAVLGEVPLFNASLASIYPFVSGVTVITGHDRDWMGQHRDASSLVATILDREIDPERKIDLIVTSEINEARARNRAMDYAAPRGRSTRVVRQHEHDPGFMAPDYFLIIDADEIYEATDLQRLIDFVARERRRVYRVPCVRYFKRWNYRIDGFEWAFAFVRSDWRIQEIRGRKACLWRRGLPASLVCRAVPNLAFGDSSTSRPKWVCFITEATSDRAPGSAESWARLVMQVKWTRIGSPRYGTTGRLRPPTSIRRFHGSSQAWRESRRRHFPSRSVDDGGHRSIWIRDYHYPRTGGDDRRDRRLSPP